jgi:hypothetical protein
MPHAVLEGPIDLAHLPGRFAPLYARDADGFRKTADIFLNHRRSRVMIEATVVHAGRAQKFYISVAHQAKGSAAGATVVRLEERTDPVKNEGVRKLLAAVVQRVLELFPGTRIARTNLQDYL